MNALLIYTEIPDTFWSFKYSLAFIKKKSSFPPLGLLTVAAMLPRDWNLQLVDMNTQRLTDRHLEWADCAFFSCMTVQQNSALKAIRRCRQKSVTVVAGGPLFSTEPGAIEGVDHFVLNEAEVTLPRFLADLACGKPGKMYASDSFADITSTPVPRWDLVDFKKYAEVCIQFSRGCPYNCEFCNVTALFGHRPRIKTTGQILDELESIHAKGYRGSVFFVDDNFIGNKKYLKTQLLPALIQWQKTKPGITFHTEVSINLADDPELMQMMVDAGFDIVFIGIETPDDASLTECKKMQNINRDMVADIKLIQQSGLQVQGGFIVGFDHDTTGIFDRQIEFIQKTGIVTAMVGLLQAVPGTRLYERLKQEGRLRGKLSGDNVDGTTNIVPSMNIESLYEGYRNILEYIYAPRNYYRRVRAFLKDYTGPKVKNPVDFNAIMAFIRSIVRLGVIGRERFHYWGLLIWALLHRPRHFGLAVTFAIHGFHFRKIVKLTSCKGELHSTG